MDNTMQEPLETDTQPTVNPVEGQVIVNQPPAEKPGSVPPGENEVRKPLWLMLKIGVIVIMVAALAGGGYWWWNQKQTGFEPTSGDQPLQTQIKLPQIQEAVFSKYKAQPLQVTPALPTYTIAVSELANLVAIEQAENRSFGGAEQLKLEANHMLFRPSQLSYNEDPNQEVSPMTRVDDMVDLYRSMGGDSAPWERKPENAVFVTSDYLLHLYHVFIGKVFENIEEEKFHPTLKTLTKSLYSQAIGLGKSESDPELKASLERVAALMAVPYSLLEASVPKVDSFNREANEAYAASDEAADSLDKSIDALSLLEPSLPSELQEKVEKELELIYKAESMAASPLYDEYRSKAGLANPEDYTQYGPRSHYTKNSLLRSYFRAMMWFGRQGLVTKSPELTLDALVITWLMGQSNEGSSHLDRWESIYLPTVFFVGRSDDLSVYDYFGVLEEVYGETVDIAGFADSQRLDQARGLIDTLQGPAIMGDAFIGGDVFAKTKEELQDETKAFRFMGQRFIPDSYMFSQLTQGDELPDPETGQKLPSTPTALMVMSLLGSERAGQELDTWIRNNAAESDRVIPKVMKELEVEFSGLDEADWTQNIYWTWVYTLKGLFEPAGAGYPVFMQQPVWEYKSLNTALGSWTELRHDTLLYAKQSYAEMGGGGEPPEPPEVPKGYVEPNPVFFERFEGLATMTYEGLDSRELLNPTYKARMEGFLETLDFLRQIVIQQLDNQTISEEDFERLRNIGRETADLAYPLAGDLLTEGEARSAIIADVHTDVPKGQILYEATGLPRQIYVAVKDVNGTRLTRGVVYSYYEFGAPLGQRLTDEAWQEKVYGVGGEMPELPGWAREKLLE